MAQTLGTKMLLGIQYTAKSSVRAQSMPPGFPGEQRVPFPSLPLNCSVEPKCKYNVVNGFVHTLIFLITLLVISSLSDLFKTSDKAPWLFFLSPDNT